ncbi:hypothetical protein HQ584_08610 [Patescibacteria group bacterium]|nr:hypothetical protein [Patescibacteria group bacterium]
MRKSEKSYAGWYFLLTIIVLYLIAGFLKINVILPSLRFSLRIIKNIIPVFIVVFAIMVALNYLINPESVRRYLGKSAGFKKWLIAVVGGIISMGPIYMRYPMIKELKNKGVKYGFIATFLYNRAIKPALIPMIILYFGLKYTVVLTIVMAIISVIQGIIFEKIEGGGYL